MRLRLKTKLVLGISGVVCVLVMALSVAYVSQLMRQRIGESYANAQFIAQEVLHGARQALEPGLPTSVEPLDDPAKVDKAVAAVLQSNAPLGSLLQSIVGFHPEVYDTAITDNFGVVLLHSDSALMGGVLQRRRELKSLLDGGFISQVTAVYGRPRVYEVVLPVQRNGAAFGEIRVGISTIFLKNELRPMLNRALGFSAAAMVLSLLLAALLSTVALRPLEVIARRLDAIAADVSSPEAESPHRTDEFGAVSTRIDRLGRQFQDVKEVFSALKENLDQIMGALQEGLILFTRDSRAVLISASAERFVGRPRGEILGAHVEQIFDDSTLLGRIVLDAFALHQPVFSRELNDGSRRLQMSLDFIEEREQPIGALLTVRDAESVRRIEDEIELSRRLAAIGRLTSGVAHEVKNPINAIVIHLEILRERLLALDPETRRHMDIISSEIHRLDRVVKTLVDFTRPVELKHAETDLRELTRSVVELAAPEAARHGVQIESQYAASALEARVDVDMIKQALLNVVINGIQAMPDGGTLQVKAYADGPNAVLEVRDHGAGIPPELQGRIFNLYFTTKQTGSGIGLATTYRVLQLHNGTLDFESEPGQGATFRLVLPLGNAVASATQMHSRAASNTMKEWE